VHRAVTKTGKEVAVKLQYPGKYVMCMLCILMLIVFESLTVPLLVHAFYSSCTALCIAHTLISTYYDRVNGIDEYVEGVV
jgi:hypothetical protein